MTIKTNGHRRELHTFGELPAKAREYFDYLSEDDHHWPRFVLYRGSWYDVLDFVRVTVAPEHASFGHNVDPDSPLAAWDAIATESYFSAVLMRWWREEDYLEPDHDFVVMGYYFE